MGLGPVTAGDQNTTVLANAHLVAHKGDYKVKTAANVRSGRLVVRDTTDKEIKAAIAGDDPMGWVDYRVKDAVRDRAADFAAEDVLHIIGGHGVIVQARLASGENVTAGGLAVAAAAGEVKAAATLQVASGATAVTSTAANGEIITGSYPPDGILVGRFHESVDATLAAKDIAVESFI